MKTLIGRAAGPLRLVASVCAMSGLLSLMTGCGALSAMANPKVAWAIGDPAPMSVVVRRADAAENTAKQVDRLLTSTPVSADAGWLKSVGPTNDDAAAAVKAVKSEPMYAKSHARVVPAEVWAWTLGEIQSSDGSSPNLLALVSSDLGDAYAAISAKQADIADAKATIAKEKEAKDAKDASDADKTEHQKTIDELEKKVSKLEDEVDPLRKKFLAAAKEAAQKAPGGTRDAIGPALVNLRQAVDDASIADGAAAVRFPLAIKSLPDSIQEVVPVFVADIIEEQTGHRPTMNGFKPDIKLDGTDVKLTINGLGSDDLGKLSIGDLTTQTIDRTKKWVGHALTIIASVASTKDALSFEEDTLDALLDGFAAGGWKKADAAKIPDEKDPKVASATAKVHVHLTATASAKTGVTEAQPKTTAGATGPKSTTQTNGTTGAGSKPAKGDKGSSKKPGKTPTTAGSSPSTSKVVVTGGPSSAPVRPEDFNP